MSRLAQLDMCRYAPCVTFQALEQVLWISDVGYQMSVMFPPPSTSDDKHTLLGAMVCANATGRHLARCLLQGSRVRKHISVTVLPPTVRQATKQSGVTGVCGQNIASVGVLCRVQVGRLAL